MEKLTKLQRSDLIRSWRQPQTAECPECGRDIVIEAGRFSQHTDKRRWHDTRPIPACPAAGLDAISGKGG